MCYAVLETAENKQARTSDLGSIHDFLDQAVVFMANITFVLNIVAVPVTHTHTHNEQETNRTRDTTEQCEFAKLLADRCQRLQDAAGPPQAQARSRRARKRERATEPEQDEQQEQQQGAKEGGGEAPEEHEQEAQKQQEIAHSDAG